MSPAAMLLAAAAMYAVAWAADRIERRLTARQPGPQSPHREPPPSPLTAAEQAHLAALALRHGHGDPEAGRMLADYLRTRCPGIADADLMRCVLALGCVARYFRDSELTATDALAAYLHAMAGAALDLTQFERDEMPR